MTSSSAVGSGKRTRSTTKSHHSRVSARHHSTKAADEEGETKKPSIDELRRRRAAYFARPVAERQKVIRPKASAAESAATRSKTHATGERRSCRRGHRSSTGSSRKAVKSLSESERRAADFVYGTRTGPEEAERSRTEDAAENDGENASRSRERRRHSSRTSSHSRHTSRLLDAEVTPDDSISVVAEKRLSSSRTSSAKTRPSLKRSSTTSTKLAPIAEGGDASSLNTGHRTSKRESTLLGSLLRRQSTTSIPTTPRLIECLTCGSDDVPHAQSAKLPCGHRMCHECLKRVFDLSVKDPAHMPPRCCTDEHIPLKHVDKLFDLKFKMLWNRKYQEYNTKNRIYCPSPKCGEWIKPSHIHRDSHGRKYAQCPKCKIKVCTLCNNKMHKSKDCPKDPEIAKLVEQAKEKGWQRCFQCNSLVELKEGCNHMTCRCRAEFCMICGAKWKSCDCPWFNYTNLPNPDQLNHMRVPEPIQIIYRRVFDATAPADAPAPRAARRDVQPERTYQQEMDERGRQERLDEDLARRLQLASLMEGDDNQPAQRQANMETWGLGNAAGHFMNQDFVQNAANVVMAAFGDANFGRRGERASGRRRRARRSEQNDGDGGLAPNFLGDESVLGVGPARRPTRTPS